METTVQRRAINQLRWTDEFRFDQGHEVSNYQRTLYLAGQVAIDPDGSLVAEGDMAGQIDPCIANIEAVLAEADTTVENVVGLNIYTTDVNSFLATDQAINRLFDAGCRYSSTLIGVERLAFAEFLVELEATAVA
jgi:enamine deaminase RidA (YjgF/YER057c/UK114 family)